MKRRLILRVFTIAITLALLVAALPLAPVLAATVTLAPSSGTVGSYVTVTGGGGYHDGDTVFLIQFGSASPITRSGTVTGGIVATNFQVPAVSRGSYTVTVYDQSSNFATSTFVVTPRITVITPTLGTVGTTVTVSGNGFQANSSVNILFDTTTVATTTASATGVIPNVIFLVPAGTKGAHTVKGVDSVGPSATRSFTITPKITIAPAEGGVGDTVLITGSGFAGNDAIDILFDDAVLSGITAATGANGSFSTAMAIPSASRGSHIIKARDDSFNSATATLTIGHNITVTPTAGLVVGDTLAIDGNGFDANKTMTITWGGVAITTSPATVTTTSSGTFSASITTPGTQAGTYAVVVSDGVNSATTNVTVDYTTSISQTTSQASPGHVGTEFTISGTGYAAGTITVTYDTIALATTTSDTAGVFSVTFTILESPGGIHVIKVADGAGTSKQWDFFMEEQAPAAPALTLPEEAVKAKQPVIFDWQDVTDDSGVTYTFQLSTDAGFATLVLEQTGLTASDFALTEAQELESVSKDIPYHWRVKATDGAANESAWSAGTFTVGFTLDLPLWAIIVLSVVGGLGLLGLGFWLGRRSVAY